MQSIIFLYPIATKKCNIFYTINNQKPDPFQKYGEKYTYKYKAPFTLTPGNVTIKALAMSKDGSNHSAVVTKLFFVYRGEEVAVPNEEKEVIVYIMHLHLVIVLTRWYILFSHFLRVRVTSYL